MILKKIILFGIAILALSTIFGFIKETFAAVGTEVWQSTRVNRPTRNMSYDLRGQPLSARFDPYTSPWNISTLPVGVARQPTNMQQPYLTQKQFQENSIGLTLEPEKTIQKGYLKGWPEAEINPVSSWINPALLNMHKRWGFYKF